jgi:hypothetical protein
VPARQLLRRCRRDDACKRIRGGVEVNGRTLADFRVRHGDWLRRQLVAAVARLSGEGLAPLERIGQDGLRVRAWAGSDSFHPLETLRALLAQARERLRLLRDEGQAAAAARALRPGGRRTKKEAARLRGARDRCQRLAQAVRECEQAAQAREERHKGDGAKTRISAADPEARRMKMADGGFRPASDVQVATGLEALVPVGAFVVDAGQDAGQPIPMRRQAEADCGRNPQAWHADGSCATHEETEALARAGVTAYAPIEDEEKQRAEGQDPSARKKRDSDEVARWRQRMASAEGEKEYRRRGKAERTNAEARRRGLARFRVRGLCKVAAVAWRRLWALAAVRGWALRQGQTSGATPAQEEGLAEAAGGPRQEEGSAAGKEEAAIEASG